MDRHQHHYVTNLFKHMFQSSSSANTVHEFSCRCEGWKSQIEMMDFEAMWKHHMMRVDGHGVIIGYPNPKNIHTHIYIYMYIILHIYILQQDKHMYTYIDIHISKYLKEPNYWSTLIHIVLQQCHACWNATVIQIDSLISISIVVQQKDYQHLLGLLISETLKTKRYCAPGNKAFSGNLSRVKCDK